MNAHRWRRGVWLWPVLAIASIVARSHADPPPDDSKGIIVKWVPSFNLGFVALFVTNHTDKPVKVAPFMDCRFFQPPGAAQIAQAAVPMDDGAFFPTAEFTLGPNEGLAMAGGGALPAPFEIGVGETRVIELSLDDGGNAPDISTAVSFYLSKGKNSVCETKFIRSGGRWIEASAGGAVDGNGKLPAVVEATGDATKERPWKNDLGMKFAPVARTKALFSVWDTRVSDYRAFIDDVNAGVKSYRRFLDRAGNYSGYPGLAQEATHPVVSVSWDDAKAFCDWLTEKERKAGVITAQQSYRLPTDKEWSTAAGKTKYPWGNDYPPPRDTANLFFSSNTTPVGSYKPNDFGLYDMAGNVWQWCEDFFTKQMDVDAGITPRDDGGGKSYHVLRGSPFNRGGNGDGFYLSSARWVGDSSPGEEMGFRCVLAGTPKDAAPGKATKEQPWENSLGMKFVPVAGTDVLFGIWDTRVQDYAKFTDETVAMLKNYEDMLRETESARTAFEIAQFDPDKEPWPAAGFKQDDSHPAVMVSWNAARAFCEWLTERDRKAGLIGFRQRYRLPTDWEWTTAAGANAYSWGNRWPPPKGAGNYAKSFGVDDFEKTSPAGSFAANEFGLFDMGGNVWQWCGSKCRDFSGAISLAAPHKTGADASGEEGKAEEYYILRGASWDSTAGDHLELSTRGYDAPGASAGDRGFRCVLVTDDSPE
ncbi:MAG TPA: SUMF1/EgtB/PvdO family nonheme iron enzyme [Chthoniobacteraceae bacterium]|nr:SUMF1/EgtB/PvdO family nonheme iron enzyme [Chthoniobacteraceae bacterium]